MKKKKDGFIRDLTGGSVTKQLLLFAAPLFFSGMLQTVYNMVDMIMVGNFVGSEGLSAVSGGGELLNLLTFVAMGISSAGQIIIAQYIGAGKPQKLGKIIGTLFTTLAICAFMMTGSCLILRIQILRWLNMQEEAFQYAVDYITPCIVGLLFIYGYNLISAVLRGIGDSRHPFLFVAVASVMNIILDFLLIGCLDMGTYGAALATVISQAFSFVCGMVFLYHKRKHLGFEIHKGIFCMDFEILRSLLRLGIPMALQSAAVTFSKLYITSWVNSYGVVAAAVTGIGNKLITVTNVFSQALATASGTMIAQNIGAEKYKRVPKIVGISMLVDAVAAAVLSVATLAFPEYIFGIFSKETKVLEMAVSYVPVAIVMYVSCILRPPMNGLINGSGNSRLNVMIALLDGIIVRIGLAMFLGKFCNMGISGFWYGNAFAGYVPFFIGGIYFISGKWKTQKYILKK